VTPLPASIAAEVVSEIGNPGQRARTARTTAALGAGASVSRPSVKAWTWTPAAPA
jgi:hypothetical protein